MLLNIKVTIMSEDKKLIWTPEEDEELQELFESIGSKWDQISHELSKVVNSKKKKDAKQCRERWIHVLNPENKKNWTEEETLMMFKLHDKYGNQWAEIAEQMPGKTDNTVKDHFYCIIRTGLRRMLKKLGVQNVTNKIKSIKTCVLCEIGTSQKSEQKIEWEEKSKLDLITSLNANAQKGLTGISLFIETQKDKLIQQEMITCEKKIEEYKLFLKANAEIQSSQIINFCRSMFELYLLLWNKNFFNSKRKSDKKKQTKLEIEENISQQDKEWNEFFYSILNISYWNNN